VAVAAVAEVVAAEVVVKLKCHAKLTLVRFNMSTSYQPINQH
jgi:hypothetical protein